MDKITGRRVAAPRGRAWSLQYPPELTPFKSGSYESLPEPAPVLAGAASRRRPSANRASRWGGPMGSAARRLALLAFFALSACLAGPLWAATGNVSNLNLTASDGLQILNDYPSAQGFTADDDHGAGYTLQSVTLPLVVENADDVTVALYSDSSGSPDTSRATLTGPRPTSRTMTQYVYTCSSNCHLTAGRSYFIVFTPGRQGTYRWGQNTSGTETNTPSTAEWSIADDAKYRDGAGGNWLSEGAVKLMKVSWETATAPGKEAGLTASAGSGASVDLSWTAVTGATGYKVQYKSGAQDWSSTATLTLANHTGTWYYKQVTPTAGTCSTGVSTTSTTANGLSPGRTHTFSGYSDEQCTGTALATTPQFLTKPGKVAGMTATAANGSLNVSWTATTGATAYIVQWKSSADSDWDATNQQLFSAIASANIPSLTNGTTYTVRVAAANDTGDGAWSDTATLTPTVTLTESNVTATGATLTVAGHTGTVYLAGRGGNSYSLACTAVSGSTHSPTLQGNTTYQFKVYNNSSCTGTALASTGFTTPGAIKLFADNIKQTSVTLYLQGWRSLPKAPLSRIVHKAGSAQPHRSCGVFRTPSLATHLNYDSLEPGTTYTAQYFRGNSCAAIERFASVTFTTLSDAAPKLSVSNVTDTGANLNATLNY